MSMDDVISRCDVCGQVWPYNAPTPGPGDCSCLRCSECGEVFAEGDTYCRPCDDGPLADYPRSGFFPGEYTDMQDRNQQVNP